MLSVLIDDEGGLSVFLLFESRARNDKKVAGTWTSVTTHLHDLREQRYEFAQHQALFALVNDATIVVVVVIIVIDSCISSNTSISSGSSSSSIISLS